MARANYGVWKVKRGTEEKLASEPFGYGTKSYAGRHAEECNKTLGEKEGVEYKVFLMGYPYRFRIG